MPGKLVRVFNIIYLVCVWMFCLHECLHFMHTWCPWRLEESIGSPGTRVTDAGDGTGASWELRGEVGTERTKLEVCVELKQ